MRRRSARLLISVVLAVALMSCADKHELTSERHPLSLGQSTVELVVHRSSMPGLTYLNLHDDENTAVEAALEVLREKGGTFFELQHGGSRTISFELNDSTYFIDPNRIFTNRGIDSTLARSGSTSRAARDAVSAFADALLHRVGFDALDFIVSVHNNSDDGYSALSYMDGGALDVDARFVHVSEDEDADDFYLVTSQVFYDALRDAGSNVVMQDNQMATDDGSLSVYAGIEGVPYINVEAQAGHIETQRAMIGRLHRILVEQDGRP